MQTFTVDAETRPAGRAATLRRSRRIPAVFYGAGKQNMHLALNYDTFKKVFDKAGESSIIELQIEGKTQPVLVHDVQYHPITDEISHVDFIFVDMNKEVTTSVHVVAEGVAPAVKNEGGILQLLLHELTVRCLPKDLPHHITVDVTPLVDFHTTIHVKDLKLPQGVTAMHDPEASVATVAAPKMEEELAAEAAAQAAAAAAAVPVEGVAGAAPVAEGAAGATPAATGTPAGEKAAGKKG